MKTGWKTLIIGVLIVTAFVYFFLPKKRVKHRRHHSVAYAPRRHRTTAQRRAAFVHRSRGRKSGGKSRKMIRYHGRMLTPKQWGAAMQRARRRA